MTTLSAIYDRVLVFGGGSPPTDGPPIAKIGGLWRQPDYGLSYLLAARYVIESGREGLRQNEVALPAAYLQRHALEIALKDLIEEARGIKADRAWLEALKSDLRARRPAQPKVEFEHGLRTLITQLGAALEEIALGNVPAEFAILVERVVAVEGTDPTRVRYSRDKGGKESFPSPIVIPVGQTQEQLEQLFEKYLHAEPWTGGDGLGTLLAEECAALAQKLYEHGDA